MKKPFKIYLPASICGRAIFVDEIEVDVFSDGQEEVLTDESLDKITAAQQKAIQEWEGHHLNTKELESKIIDLKFSFAESKYEKGYNQALNNVLNLLDGQNN